MIGDVIKKLRVKKNITQKQLADKLELAQSTIGMVESNKREVSLETLSKLSIFFNVSADYLLELDDEENTIPLKPNSLGNIIHNYKWQRFTDRDLEDIKNFLEYVVYRKNN